MSEHQWREKQVRAFLAERDGLFRNPTLDGALAYWKDHDFPVPLDPSVYALESLDDLQQSFRDIEESTGRPIHPIAALLTRYVEADGPGRIPSQEIEASLKAVFHPVFVVPVADEIYQTQKEGVPISHYAPRSGVGKAYEKITRSIRNLAAHIPVANNP